MHACLLPNALLEYLDLLQTSPCPLQVALPMIMIMIMIEIWHSLIIAGEPMYTASKQLHRAPQLRIYCLKRRQFIASYVQPVLQQCKSTTVSKELL